MSIPSQLTSSSLMVALALKKEYNLCNESSILLAKSILTSQASIAENRALLLGKTDAVPCDLLLSPYAIFPIKAENFIAQGGYSKVYKVSMITTRPHTLGSNAYEQYNPGDITPIALKIWENKIGSSVSYSPEKNKLQRFLSPRKRGIDEYLATFKIPSYAGYSVNKLFDSSLTRTHFEKYNSPIKTMLRILKSSIRGLCSIHDRDGLHRDIKGGNILTLINQDEIIGALTDFTFVTPEPRQIHSTIGTPEYLDPGMFGSIEDTLINQKKRLGLQTKAGDIYAFGITIYVDVLLQFLIRMSKDSGQKDEMIALIKKIIPQIVQGTFQDTKLQEYGKNNPYRVTYLENSISHPERLKIYPPLNELRTTLIDACKMLNNRLTSSEIKALHELSSLSCDMQNPDLNNRPDVYQVKKKLSSIIKDLENNESWKKSANDSNSPSKTKRKLDFLNEAIPETLPFTSMDPIEPTSLPKMPSKTKRKLDFLDEAIPETLPFTSMDPIEPASLAKITPSIKKRKLEFHTTETPPLTLEDSMRPTFLAKIKPFKTNRKLDFYTTVTPPLTLEDPTEPTSLEKIIKVLSEQMPQSSNQMMMIAFELTTSQKIIPDGMIKPMFINNNLFYLTNTGVFIFNNKIEFNNSDVFHCIFIPTMNHQLGPLQCFSGKPLKTTLKISNKIEIERNEQKKGKDDFTMAYQDANGTEYRFSNYIII